MMVEVKKINRVEKLISALKAFYLFIVVSGLFLFVWQIYYVTVIRKYTLEILSFVSALVIVMILFTGISAFFMLIIGLIRKLTAKDDKDMQVYSKKLFKQGIVLLLLSFFVWAAINIYTALAYDIEL